VKKQPGYRTGGARGEVARGTSGETETTKGASSSRLVSGTTAIMGTCVATTEAVVEQTGQTCEGDGAEVRSEQ